MCGMMRIGYFGDGPWAHEAFKKIVVDETIKIVFVTVRYDKQDQVLIGLAVEHGIPVEIYQNINLDGFLNTVKNNFKLLHFIYCVVMLLIYEGICIIM